MPTPMVRHRSTVRPGFSFVELTVVLMIGAILAAIAVPRYGEATRQYRVSMAAKRIVADLALAQTRARTTSSTAALVFNVGANGYELPGMRGLDRAAEVYSVTLGKPPYEVTLLEAFASNSGQISFDGFGKPVAGGTVRIGIGDIQRTITVDADSGKAVVQ